MGWPIFYLKRKGKYDQMATSPLCLNGKGGGDEMVASPCYLKGRGMEWPPFYMNEHVCFPQGIKLMFIEQIGFPEVFTSVFMFRKGEWRG